MKSAKRRPSTKTPIRPGGLDKAIFLDVADALIVEEDEAIRDGLRLVASIKQDIIADGPLMAYYRLTREEAVKAIKALPDCKPGDFDSVVAVQAAIGDYLRLHRFVVQAFQVTTPRDDVEVEDRDRLAGDDQEESDGGRE